jgi:hypothetical protein
MTILRAHERFASRKDRSIFPHSVSLRGYSQLDVWPAVATAAVSCAGHLEDATTDEDLDAGIRAYESYVEMGSLDDEQLEGATMAVIQELLDWGDKLNPGRLLEAAAYPAS